MEQYLLSFCRHWLVILQNTASTGAGVLPPLQEYWGVGSVYIDGDWLLVDTKIYVADHLRVGWLARYGFSRQHTNLKTFHHSLGIQVISQDAFMFIRARVFPDSSFSFIIIKF